MSTGNSAGGISACTAWPVASLVAQAISARSEGITAQDQQRRHGHQRHQGFGALEGVQGTHGARPRVLPGLQLGTPPDVLGRRADGNRLVVHGRAQDLRHGLDLTTCGAGHQMRLQVRRPFAGFASPQHLGFAWAQVVGHHYSPQRRMPSATASF